MGKYRFSRKVGLLMFSKRKEMFLFNEYYLSRAFAVENLKSIAIKDDIVETIIRVM